MILHASYTGVEGSNCIVFTTLHWRTQIFSDRATILVGSKTASPTYTPRTHRRQNPCTRKRAQTHIISEIDGLHSDCFQQAFIKICSHKTAMHEKGEAEVSTAQYKRNQCPTIISSGTFLRVKSNVCCGVPPPQQLFSPPRCAKTCCLMAARNRDWLN